VYLGIVGLISEFGLGSAIITLRDMEPRQVEELNLAAVFLGILSFAASCAAAIPLGELFHAPQLPLIVVAMGAGFVISSFRSIPNAILLRDLSLKRLAVIEGAQSLILAVAMVVLALLGLGYWTLVVGNLLSAAVSTLLTLSQCRRGFAWPRFRRLLPAITFSGQVLASRLAWYFYSTSDFLVAGRRLGKEPLGAYSLAWTIASVPIEKIGTLIFNTTPAYFSALQRDMAALRRNLLHLTEGISTLTIPLSVGLALVAREFVLLALGPKWEAMIPPLQLLALYSTVRSVSPLIPQILVVTGEARYSMWNSVAAAVVLPMGFYVGSRWGINGIAATWLALHPLVLVLPYRRAFRKIGMRFGDYLRSVWPGTNAALHMAAAMLAVRAFLPPDVALAARFAILVAVGVAAYAACLFLYHRDRISGLARTIRQMRGGAA
jgi:PST family polysaccharide transporter